MLRKTFAALVVPLAITAAAFAASPPSDRNETGKGAPGSGEVFSVLHAVGQWSVDLSKLADQKAKSDLVKDYARHVATTNTDRDAKLMALAQKHGVEVAPLDPQTEEGKSMIDRMKAEETLLNSLEGDAFDKEYMTLVTNTQQSVIHFLDARKATAKDPDVKQYLADMTTTVQSRLKNAQDIMQKIYGDQI